MKTMEINDLVSKLKEYDGELDVKVWSNGADKAYPINHVGQGHTDGVLDTYVSIVVDDDRNLVDLSKIWHDASEEPQGDKWHIAYIDVFGSIHSLKCPSVTFDTFPSLAEFAAGVGMQYWAYIDDLLPKGGEK